MVSLPSTGASDTATARTAPPGLGVRGEIRMSTPAVSRQSSGTDSVAALLALEGPGDTAGDAVEAATSGRWVSDDAESHPDAATALRNTAVATRVMEGFCNVVGRRASSALMAALLITCR
jgi:hypothetical protein